MRAQAALCRLRVRKLSGFETRSRYSDKASQFALKDQLICLIVRSCRQAVVDRSYKLVERLIKPFDRILIAGTPDCFNKTIKLYLARMFTPFSH